jgi:hypothetical protein
MQVGKQPVGPFAAGRFGCASGEYQLSQDGGVDAGELVGVAR